MHLFFPFVALTEILQNWILLIPQMESMESLTVEHYFQIKKLLHLWKAENVDQVFL